MQGSGCSPFFFTSALQSVIFGDKAREQQSQLMDQNLNFKDRMQLLRADFATDQREQQKAFRRESCELGRQYLISQTIEQNKARKQQIEFNDFLRHNYWPLSTDVFTYLETQNNLLHDRAIVPLNILIANTELTTDMRAPQKYATFCDSIIDSVRPLLPSTIIERAPWKSRSQSRSADALNINFIMSGIPTVIIFPYSPAPGCVAVETAAWSFARGHQSMSQTKLLKIDGLSPAEMQTATMAAVRTAVGITRDLYMLAEYHAPVLYPRIAPHSDTSIPAIRRCLSEHYTEMQQLASIPEYRDTCTASESREITHSLIGTNAFSL